MENEKPRVVCAVLPNLTKVQESLKSLHNMGISEENISVITNQEEFEKKEFEPHLGSQLHHGSMDQGAKMGIAGATVYGLTAIAGMTAAGAGLLAAGPIVVALMAAGGVMGGLLGIERKAGKTPMKKF
ncbi:MAG: hypothetical protein KJ058_18930 [Thermoanaerobaculia bacterium]|nr:hypothetical protein [Thermoanaerobaculia bacterium]